MTVRIVGMLQGNTKARCVQYKSFCMQCCAGKRNWFNYPSDRKRDYPDKQSSGYCKHSEQKKEFAHFSISSEFPKRDNRNGPGDKKPSA